MADIRQELATIQNGIYGKDIRLAIYNALLKLNENSSVGAMRYISETVNVSPTIEYKLTSREIAMTSYVNIHVGNRTTSGDTIVRSDGEDLINILTGEVVDSTMVDFRIANADILAGIKATGVMSITAKYYGTECEDLLQMISNGTETGGGERLLSSVYSMTNDTTENTVTVDSTYNYLTQI